MAEDPLESLRRDALAMVEKCIECGSCYIDCAFNNYGDDAARCQQWIRESNDYLLRKEKKLPPELYDANFKCAECNRCFNSCPERIYRRHGNMMMKHMAGNPLRHRLNIHPYSNWKVKQPAIEKIVVSRWEERERNWYEKGLNRMEKADVLLYHGCYVYLQAAQCIRLEEMLASAGVSYTSVGKLEYCCGTFAFYRGHSDMGSIKPRLLEMVERVQPKRIITNCGHCLNAMSDLAGHMDGEEIPVLHSAEELLSLVVAGKIDFSHMGETYTIHDSCNFRSLHDSHGPLRKLLRRFGNIHEMLHHGRKGKCCGDVSRYYAPDHILADNRKVKIREFVGSGADRMITVCAGCFEHFHNNPRLKTIDLIDVAYRSFAAAKAEDAAEPAAAPIKWENMAPIIEEEK
jgi:Fe-S oxidoreductase